MSFENWWFGDLLPRRCLGALPQYYYGSMTPEELLYKIVYQLNELITNNNSIPTELREAIIEYINSQEFKDYIFSLTDPKYVSKSGDTMTGKLTMNAGSPIEFLDNDTTRALITARKTNTEITRLFLGLSSDGKLNIYQLATPMSDTEAANKKYVDDKFGGLGNVLIFKGVKPTEADLPITGNNVGDVWYVEDTKSAWAWVEDTTDPNGRWDEFGPVINLEPYFKKADIVQTTGPNTTKIMSQKAATDSFVNTSGDSMTGQLQITTNGTTPNIKLKSSSLQGEIRYFSNKYLVDHGDGKYSIFQFKHSGSPYVLALAYSNTTTSNDKVISLGSTRVTNLQDPVGAQDAATKAYVDAHSGGGTYQLPIATNGTLGGVKAPPKTADTTTSVKVDANGYLWSQDLKPATANTLGGIKAPHKQAEQTQQVYVDTDGTLWVKPTTYTLPIANTSTLGGILAGREVRPADPAESISVKVENNGLAWVKAPKYVPLEDFPQTFQAPKYNENYTLTKYVPKVGDIMDITLGLNNRMSLVISDTTGVNTETTYIAKTIDITYPAIALIKFTPSNTTINITGFKLDSAAACTNQDKVSTSLNVNNVYRLSQYY